MKKIITEEEVRKILRNIIIEESDYIYDLNLNIIRRFENDYFAKSEDRALELYQISENVIEQLILEFASCAKDSIDTEEYDEALEYIEVLKNLSELLDGNINKVKLW